MHLKKEIKTLFNVAVTNKKEKKDTWYLDTSAAIHIMYNLSLSITVNPDNQTVDIKIVDNTIFKRQGAGIIDFYVFVENKHIHIKLSNVDNLPKFDTNLILFKILKKKEFKF